MFLQTPSYHWEGYDEGLLLYVLGLGSPTYGPDLGPDAPLPAGGHGAAAGRVHGRLAVARPRRRLVMSAGATPVSRQTLRRCIRSAKGLLTSEARGRALTLAALLVGFLLAINGLNVVNSYVARDFMTAIADRDTAGFTRQALLYLALFAASTAVAVLQSFTEQRFDLLWRWWMTRRLTGLYLADRNYYWLKASDGLDNPDERIADDVRAFTATTLSFVLIFLNGVLTVVAFGGVLWTISPLLFGVAVGYAALGSLLAFLLGRPLVGLNYRQLDREADFRSALIHVRENAEAVALTRHEGRLTARLLGRLDALLDNYRRIISVNRNLGFFTTGYNYLIQIIPALIVAPLFIRGQVEFGVVTQSAIAFAQLLGAFSLLVNQFGALSSYAAVTERLGALGDALDRVRPAGRRTIETVEDRDRVAFEGLTLQGNGAGPPRQGAVRGGPARGAAVDHGAERVGAGRPAPRGRRALGQGNGADRPSAARRDPVRAAAAVLAAGGAPRPAAPDRERARDPGRETRGHPPRVRPRDGPGADRRA
jgi:ABC-type uncharacterized transport system fused permease/ATPase subunit